MKVNKLDNKVLLKNATVVDPLKESQSIADILLVEGKIAEIGRIRDLDAITTIDCSGLTLTHGFCDLHVHFRDPGNGDKETLESGSMSALAGGFTRVCTMPNTQPTVDNPESINYIIVTKTNDLYYNHTLI